MRIRFAFDVDSSNYIGQCTVSCKRPQYDKTINNSNKNTIGLVYNKIIINTNQLWLKENKLQSLNYRLLTTNW